MCANISEAFRKRRYAAAFINRLNDAETEAAETQVWLEIARRCKYLTDAEADQLDEECDHVIAQIVSMIKNPRNWTINTS